VEAAAAAAAAALPASREAGYEKEEVRPANGVELSGGSFPLAQGVSATVTPTVDCGARRYTILSRKSRDKKKNKATFCDLYIKKQGA
jgi:hypothetical protein